MLCHSLDTFLVLLLFQARVTSSLTKKQVLHAALHRPSDSHSSARPELLQLPKTGQGKVVKMRPEVRAEVWLTPDPRGRALGSGVATSHLTLSTVASEVWGNVWVALTVYFLEWGRGRRGIDSLSPGS